MHEEVLSDTQRELLPLIKSLASDFGLIGGTALALQLDHRSSVDFDLATNAELNRDSIQRSIKGGYTIDSVLVDEKNEYSIAVNGVKMTFLHYPFNLDFKENFKNIIKIPDILTLASMKAFALGRRAKWKDYVDLYFVIRCFSLRKVTDKAKVIFGREFNEKLFREQLCYFEDIDYSEEVNFMDGFFEKDGIIKEKLAEFSLEKG